MGFINLLPFKIASLAPKIAPKDIMIAIGTPYKKLDFPKIVNTIRLAKLLDKFKIFVFPLAKEKSTLNIFIKQNIKNEPVPGPKKPS